MILIRKNEKNFKVKTLIIFCLITGYLLLNNLNNQRLKKHFDFFDSTELSGLISRIEYRGKMQVISLKNSVTKYYFHPYVVSTNGKSVFFDDLVQPNDSVYKPAFSDTLFVIKSKNEIYKFTFYQPN